MWAKKLIFINYVAALGACGPNGFDSNFAADSVNTNLATKLSMSDMHACVTKQGSVYCWGSNGSDQSNNLFRGILGLGHAHNIGDDPGEMSNLAAVNIEKNVVDLYLADQTTCAKHVSGKLSCWGRVDVNPFYSIVGYTPSGFFLGDNSNEIKPNVLPVANFGTSNSHFKDFSIGNASCVILENDGLKCFGSNLNGQLGYGNTTFYTYAKDSPYVNLGTGLFATKVVSNVNTCVILNNQQVKCFGTNYSIGALGTGDTVNYGKIANTMGNSLPYINLGTGALVSDIALASLSTCVILTTGQVKCWGSNSSGTLGLGNTASRGSDPVHMGDNLPTVDLGSGRTAQSIAMGESHACAILDNRKVKCWGDNSEGQLGYGDTLNRGDNANQMGDNLPFVDLGTNYEAVQIVSRRDSTCALLADDTVKCWGKNTNGLLGQGHTNNMGDNPNEMGNNLSSIHF